MPLKDGSYKGGHQVTRGKILEALKVRGGLSAGTMAKEFGISAMAIRQHLRELEFAGEVSANDEAKGKGRPTKIWTLTAKANRHFADRHRDLLVDLLSNIDATLGPEATQRLLDKRGERQVLLYKERTASCRSLEEKATKLASARSEEGYMAEAAGDGGGGVLLIENHCPICVAASQCGGLCAKELEVFRKTFEGCQVRRTEHILAGDRRCAYRISPTSPIGSRSVL